MLMITAVFIILLYMTTNATRSPDTVIKTDVFKINSMIIPGQLYGLMNTEDFSDTDIYYDYNRMEIVLEMSEPILEQHDDHFYFFQGGSYIPIVRQL